jgi:hypothetical protein
MRLVVHLARMVSDTIRFGLATRRLTFVVAVLIGLVLAAVALSAQVVAPIAIYPFA